MSDAAARFADYGVFGLRLARDLEARDDLHLKPQILTQAAAGRLKSGLLALEAYVRRCLLYTSPSPRDA